MGCGGSKRGCCCGQLRKLLHKIPHPAHNLMLFMLHIQLLDARVCPEGLEGDDLLGADESGAGVNTQGIASGDVGFCNTATRGRSSGLVVVHAQLCQLLKGTQHCGVDRQEVSRGVTGGHAVGGVELAEVFVEHSFATFPRAQEQDFERFLAGSLVVVVPIIILGNPDAAGDALILAGAVCGSVVRGMGRRREEER